MYGDRNPRQRPLESTYLNLSFGNVGGLKRIRLWLTVIFCWKLTKPLTTILLSFGPGAGADGTAFVADFACLTVFLIPPAGAGVVPVAFPGFAPRRATLRFAWRRVLRISSNDSSSFPDILLCGSSYGLEKSMRDEVD